MANKLLKTLTIDGVTFEVPIEDVIAKIGALDTTGIQTNGTVATSNGVIGERKDASSSVRIAAANTLYKGASVTLGKGKYLVIGGWTYETASTTGARKTSTTLYFNETAFLSQSTVNADYTGTIAQVIGIMDFSASTEVSVRGQANKASNTAGTTYIRTIRLA